MGGVDAYSDSIHTNLNNPASFGDLKVTTYSIGVNYSDTNFNDSTTSENNQLASVEYISISLPTKKINFGFGIYNYSSVGYNLVNQSENENGEELITQYIGNGGINKAYITLGFNLSKYLNLGGTINYNFGNIRTTNSQSFSSNTFSTLINDRSDYSGIDYTLAAQLKIPVTSKTKLLLLGIYQPNYKLKAENSRVYISNSVTQQSIGTVETIDLGIQNLANTELTIGQKIDYGVSYSNAKKWLFGAQITSLQRGNFSNTFQSLINVSYKDSYSYGFGGYYIPRYNDVASFWKRVTYRGGFRINNTGTVFNGQELSGYSINLGLGLPLVGYSDANIGLEIGSIGKATEGLIKENFVNLKIGLSLNDIWFIKRKYN